MLGHALTGPGHAKGPANEYESLDGPFWFGRRGGCQADNSLFRPAPHPPCGSLGQSPQCLSFCRVAPLFPCGICVRDLYRRSAHACKQIDQITSMEFAAVIVHLVRPLVHRLSTARAQTYAQGHRPSDPQWPPRLAGSSGAPYGGAPSTSSLRAEGICVP